MYTSKLKIKTSSVKNSLQAFTWRGFYFIFFY